MTYSNLSPEAQAAIQRFGVAISQSMRAIGEQIVVVLRPVVSALTQYARTFVRYMVNIYKKIKHRQRNLKRMNRKTRAVALRKR